MECSVLKEMTWKRRTGALSLLQENGTVFMYLLICQTCLILSVRKLYDEYIQVFSALETTAFHRGGGPYFTFGQLLSVLCRLKGN